MIPDFHFPMNFKNFQGSKEAHPRGCFETEISQPIVNHISDKY